VPITQHVAEQNVRHNHAYFYFWHGSCQTFFLAVKVPNFFLAAKTTFGSWHAGTRGIHTGFDIFGSQNHFWQNSAKNKSWHDLCQK
jgi:TRAP-type mannitol/chloroaromatic compound transport system substrate-binding protein